MGLSGDAFNNDKVGQDLSYLELKAYLEEKVFEKAKLHQFLQKPTFLEPDASDDFELLRKASGEVGVGTLFSYEKRGDGQQLDGHWESFFKKKRIANWDLENPLAIQQANALLLRMERLWYEGKTSTDLFGKYSDKLENLLNSDSGIEPVCHSLHDQMAVELRQNGLEDLSFPLLDRELLLPLPPVASDASEEEQKKASDLVRVRKKTVKQWGEANSDWRAAMSVWQALLSDSVAGKDAGYHAMIGQGLKLLSGPSQCSPDSQSGIPIEYNEIAYLRRVNDELKWNPGESFEKLVNRSLKTRDASNRFVATLPPVLVRQFEEEFEKLENRRRQLEDRLFAHHRFDEALGEMRILLSDYKKLQANADQFGARFKAAQATLVNSGHEFRFLVEGYASGFGDFGDRESDWINQFESAAKRLRDKNIDSFQKDVTVEIGQGFDELFESFNKVSMEVADTNLKGRRLLFWPSLSPAIRKQIREGLAGFVSPGDSDHVATSGLTSAELDLLGKRFSTEQASELNLAQNEEAGLLRGARRSVQEPLYRKGAPTELENGLARLLSRFRARKSDLEFERIASDLWGSNATNSDFQTRRPFVYSATERHRNETNARLDELENQSDDHRLDHIRGVWENECIANWEKRLPQLKEFCDGFEMWRWQESRNENDDQQCSNSSEQFFKSFNREFGSHASMAVSANNSTRFEIPENIVDSGGEQIGIYLRGHSQPVNVRLVPRAAPDKVATRLQFTEGIKGTRLEIDRAPDVELEKPLGEVSLLLDCSLSMKPRFTKVQKYVKSFLTSASAREDVRVSIYAFGASQWTDGQEFQQKDPTTLSPFERVKKQHDVWRYPARGPELLKPAKERGFLTALAKLEPYGETPILSALELAVEEKKTEPHLLVLLTDGFEFTKAPGAKFHEPLEPRQLERVRQKLNDGSRSLIIFNMFKVGEGSFQKAFNSTVPENEIKTRIAQIGSLSPVKPWADGDASLGLLGEFLRGVLPKYKLSRSPEFTDVRSWDVEDVGTGIQQSIQLGPEDRPKQPWQLSLGFRPPDQSIAAFAKAPVEWSTTCKNFGNEVLEFRYNPVGRNFSLFTEWKSKISDRTLSLASGKLGVRNKSKKDRPRLQLASLNSTQMTPAPALIWLKLQDQEGRSILVQDFFLPGQTLSNVHEVLFPEIEKVLQNRTLVPRDSKLDMTVHWMDRIRRGSAWTRIDLSQIDLNGRIGSKKEPVREKRALDFGDLLAGDEFKGYKFSVLRESLGSKKFSIKINVKSPDGKPLDVWLIQLLDKDGNEPHRTCRRETFRSYRVTESIGGRKQVEEITHEFVVNREDFETGATLGIAHIDEIKDLPSVEFKGSFEAE